MVYVEEKTPEELEELEAELAELQRLSELLDSDQLPVAEMKNLYRALVSERQYQTLEGYRGEFQNQTDEEFWGERLGRQLGALMFEIQAELDLQLGQQLNGREVPQELLQAAVPQLVRGDERANLDGR